MERPTYEDQGDRDNETRLQGIIEAKWRCKLEKVHKKYGADFYSFRDGQVVGILEIKNRSCPSTQYQTYMISLAKVKTCLEYA